MLSLNNPGPSVTAPPKREHKALIGLGILVLLVLLLGLVFHNTAFVGRFTGAGYDTNPLPLEAIPQPAFTNAVYTVTTQSIGVSDGLPTNFWRTERDEVDYKAQIAKLTIDRAKASIIGGTIGRAASTAPPLDLIVDQQSTYLAGEKPTDPWTRQPHQPGWGALGLLDPHGVLMYQDVIDPVLRAQQPTSVIQELVHDVPVTTYTYTFTFGEFYESAPRLFDLVQVIDGNAGADASVVVTVSLDAQWIVRYVDVNVDFNAVLKYKAEHDAGTSYPYRYTVDVLSASDGALAIAVPPNTLDATTTTTIAPPVGP